MKNKGVIYLVCCLFAVACTEDKAAVVLSLPYINSADFTPEWVEDQAIENVHQVADFEFVNQEGQLISHEDYEGKIYLVDFFYSTCPGICKSMTKNMYSLYEHYEGDTSILFLSHTVMSEVDSVARLKHYADLYGIDSKRWNLVTGNKEAIYEMARKEYFIEQNAGLKKSLNELVHTENFLLIDHHRRIRGIYNGTSRLEMKRIIADIELLRKELK